MKKFWYVIMFLCFWGLVTKAEEHRPTSLSEERGPVSIREVVNHYNLGKFYPETISPNIVWESFVGTDTDMVFTYTLLQSRSMLLALDFESAARIDKGEYSCAIFAIDIENLEAVVHRYFDINHVYVFEVRFTEYDCMLF